MSQSQLDAVEAQILADDVCPELAAGAKQLVFGEGSPSADIMFIGEAPGKNEDEQGKPFVGAAGRFLNTMLEAIGLKRQQVYITSILKYRPPGNRDPKPTEIAAFLPYLKKQIEIIKPKLLIPLGRHAMGIFLPGLSIGTVHGQQKRKNGQVYLPLYHPAVALYNNSMRSVLLEDFRKISKTLELIKNSPELV